MYTFVLGFVLLLAVANAAVPDLEAQIRSLERNSIERTIRQMIIDISNEMEDPMLREGYSFAFQFPESDILKASAVVGDVIVRGHSEIRINNVDVSTISRRARIDLTLPHVYACIAPSEASVKIFDAYVGGELGGCVVINGIHIFIDIRVRIGLTGISVQSVLVRFRIEDIESNVELIVLGNDLSYNVNHFVSVTIPETLRKHSNEINQLLAEIIKEMIERAL